MEQPIDRKHVHKQYQVYESIVENASDIILVMTPDGGIIDANKEAVRAYGYTYEELTGMHVFQLRDPERLELANLQFDTAKKDGTEFETTHFRKDGSTFPVEVKSIGVDDGSNTYVVSIIRDISNRRKKDEEMRVLASIVESSPYAIFGTTIDGYITSWNKGAEKLYSYSKAEILGKHASIMLPEGSNDNINSIIDNVRLKEKTQYYEAIRRKKDGQNFRVSISISPIYNFEGSFAGVSITARDLTEMHVLARRLNQQEEQWKLANELMLGNIFQASLMSSTKNFGFAEMYGKYIPSSMVGGDLYDCVAIGDSLWFLIADVAGHGLVAAMISTMLKGLFSNSVHHCTYPHEVLENMNSILNKFLNEYDAYLVSAFVGVIRGSSLYYSNAGHPYPVMVDCKDGRSKVLEQSGYLLAMMEKSEYKTKHLAISKDNVLLLYTDGLFNLRSENGFSYWDSVGEFSLKNLHLVKENPPLYMEKLVEAFRGDFYEDFDDDVSLLLIKTL